MDEDTPAAGVCGVAGRAEPAAAAGEQQGWDTRGDGQTITSKVEKNALYGTSLLLDLAYQG